MPNGTRATNMNSNTLPSERDLTPLGLQHGDDSQTTCNGPHELLRSRIGSPITYAAPADVAHFEGPAEVQRTDTNSPVPHPSTAKYTFFSLPAELRCLIYGYLSPQRVHIADARTDWPGLWFTCDYLRNSRTRPWALTSVSSQFRAEIRSFVYPRTPIVIHMRSSEMRESFKIWLEGLDEGLASSIHHLGINGYIEFNYLPNGPIVEQPLHWVERQYQEWAYEPWEESDVCEEKDTFGDWGIKWLQYPYNVPTLREDRMDAAIYGIKAFLEHPSTAMIGLGKDNIRRLVTAYGGSCYEGLPVQAIGDCEEAEQEGEEAYDDEECVDWDEEDYYNVDEEGEEEEEEEKEGGEKWEEEEDEEEEKEEQEEQEEEEEQATEQERSG